MTPLIPQRAPMVMIHDLLEATDEHATTQLRIESDNIFVAHGVFTEPGLVENMAQTAAAQVGYQCAQRNIPVPIGYIAAVKDLKILALPLLNSEITTSVRILHTVMNVTVIRGNVRQGDRDICSCEMKIFIKN